MGNGHAGRKISFVTNHDGGTVSAIDVKTRTKYSTNIALRSFPNGWR
jgi:YVTN family beta-propeller protein